MNHEKVRIRHYEKLMTRHMLNNEDRRKTIKQLYLKTADINSFEDCCRLRYGSSCIQFSFLLLSEPFLNFFFFASISFDWFRVSLKNCCYRMLPVSILYPIPSIRTPNSQPPSLSSTFFFYLLHGEFYIYLSLIPFSCLPFPYPFSFMCLHAILDIVFAY